jgi:hypothetical protein
MNERIIDLVSVWDGIVRNGILYLLAGSDELTKIREPHTLLIEFDDKVRYVETLDWTARDIAPDPEYSEGAIAMGLDGNLIRFRNGLTEYLPVGATNRYIGISALKDGFGLKMDCHLLPIKNFPNSSLLLATRKKGSFILAAQGVKLGDSMGMHGNI